MVWLEIAVGVRTDLHIFSLITVTTLQYRDDLIAQYVCPFIATMGANSVFTDDNIRVPKGSIVS